MVIELHGSELSKIRAHCEEGGFILSTSFIDRSNNQNFKNIGMLLIQVKVHLNQQNTPTI
jgi:hypothetical protein